MIYKITQRLIFVNHLISRKATGTPKEMAQKLGLSERAWYKLRDQLINDLKFPIAYCKYQKTYYYTVDGYFQFGFKPITKEKKQGITGGGFLNNHTNNYQKSFKHLLSYSFYCFDFQSYKI